MSTTRIISEADIIPKPLGGISPAERRVEKSGVGRTPAEHHRRRQASTFLSSTSPNGDAALYTEKLLKRSSLDLMWTVFKLKNGEPQQRPLRLRPGFIEDRHGHRCIQHDGSWQGFETAIDRYVDDHLTVVALSNLGRRRTGEDHGTRSRNVFSR